MFPFKVRFSRILKQQIEVEQVPQLLHIYQNKLSEAGADYFSKEDFRLRFYNRLIKMTWNWNLMLPIDSGFVELKIDNNNNSKIRYSITLSRIWIISTLITVILWISIKDIYFPLIAFCFFGILNWLIAVLRHWIFFNSISNKMIDNIKDKK